MTETHPQAVTSHHPLHFAAAGLTLALAMQVSASASDAPQLAAPQVAPADGQREEPRPACRICPREQDPLNDPRSPLAQRALFFGLDEHELSADAQALLEHHARYLVSRPQRRLRLEGHADARGNSEHNLALGQMRAQAAYRMLMLLGVRAVQLEAVSWGEERPRAAGGDEAAWVQNRRVDLVYVR